LSTMSSMPMPSSNAGRPIPPGTAILAAGADRV
jgi:hypothetical protein